MAQHILIIDDEEDIREALRDVFEGEGCAVSTATNGREAIQLLQKGEKPDVILLDLMMPVMNGTEFVQHQRLDSKITTIPVILMSADSQTRQKALALGVQGHLRKPVELDDLIAKVHSIGNPLAR
jgi:CheY-like chemotaxis protein